MNFARFIPSTWFSHEDGDKALAVRHSGATPRDVFHSEIDRMFNNFFTSFASPSFPSVFRQTGGREFFLKPSLDLRESDKEYTVSVELPGVDEKDVSIEVSSRKLTVSGEKKEEFTDENEKGGAYRMERCYGSFRRTLSLPEDVDVDGIKAEFDKGVLHVALPKSPAKAAKKIEITK